MKDAGYNAEYAQWSGLFVPSHTPDAVVQRLRAASRAAANDPKVKDTILGAGSPILYMDSPEFEKYVQQDAHKMAEVVKKIGKVQ
jgi:tripartite-type tricarboxylate transporter receptor subunit TctC